MKTIIALSVALFSTLIINKAQISQPRFEARYVEFHVPYCYSGSNQGILEKGYDVTSLLANEKVSLIEILKSARKPATYEEDSVRLAVQYEGEVWFVDRRGTVLHRNRANSLSDQDFKRLSSLLSDHLPFNPKKPYRRSRPLPSKDP